MKKLTVALLAIAGMTAPASAADLYGYGGGSLKDGPVAAFTWTGFYAGIHAGYAWGDVDHSPTNGGVAPGPFSYDADGAFGGATLGFNWQFDQIVAGAEAEGGYMDLSGDGRIPSSNPAAHQDIDVDGGAYALIAGRLGLALGHTLIYGKAGYAWVDGDTGQKTTNPGYKTFRSDSLEGFVYGGGIEHALNRRMTIKVEYLHFDFDDVSGYQLNVGDQTSPIGFKFTNKSDVDADTVKLGLNIKLN
jgi:outer membrane immunogenic protein